MKNVIVKTDFEFALDEPDFQIHFDEYDSDGNFKFKELQLNCSAGEDNSTDINLINEVIESTKKETVNWLDLGTGGGQLILDVNNHPKTDICIGLDGSCGVFKQENWKVESNRTVLRNADLTKEFFIELNEELLKFDVISSSEVIEHFEESQLDQFFQNVYNHLVDDGVFFGSIALFPDTRDENGFYESHPGYNPNSSVKYVLHKTVYESRVPWDAILTKYFNILDYDFSIRMRNHNDSYYFKCTKKV